MHEDELARVPLFSKLSKQDLHTLGTTCHERDYPAGDTLLRQGDTAMGLFVIVRGKVSVTQHRDADDAGHEINTLGPGDVIGEMALLDDLPRSATVTAVEPTHVLVLPVWDFRAILRDHPDITIKLLAMLSQRLRHAEQRDS